MYLNTKKGSFVEEPAFLIVRRKDGPSYRRKPSPNFVLFLFVCLTK